MKPGFWRDCGAMAAAGGAFGGNRGMQPLAPEKGVFPLDHLQECKHVSLNFFLDFFKFLLDWYVWDHVK